MLDENRDNLSSEEINENQEDTKNDKIKNLQKDGIDNEVENNKEEKTISKKKDTQEQSEETKDKGDIKEEPLTNNSELNSEIDENTDSEKKEKALDTIEIKSENGNSEVENSKEEKTNSKKEDTQEQSEDTKDKSDIKEEPLTNNSELKSEIVENVDSEKKEKTLDTNEVKSEKSDSEPKEDKKVEAEPISANIKSKEESVSLGNDIDEISKKKIKAKLPVVDFAQLSFEDLNDNFKNLLDNFSIYEAKSQIELLKTNFTKKFKEVLLEKKKEFIEAGGNELDFHYKSPVKNTFNDLVFEYKKKRKQYYNNLEIEQNQNLVKRLELIDELKELIDNAEASTMYKNFRVLQDKWRGIGQIPHSKYNNVWRTYHHHVERFYDLLHLNNDFRDLDFKHNLEEKSKLVEIAEKLADDKDINHAFKELQILHRMWKEDIGPVARELREEIWDRFSKATMKIHEKRHEFQDKLDDKLNDNIDLKLAVIEKIKAINLVGIDTHKAWQESIRNLEKMREEFFAIGRVPKSKNEEIWQLFKDATRKFNKAKNSFYKGIKKDQSKNLKKKLDLLEQADRLKDSDDWEMVTDVFKKIQSDWKNIGHVPSRDSDKIWKKFKNACNHYFDRLHDKQDGANKEQTEVFNRKKDFLDQFKEKLNQEDILTIDWVNENIKNWRELGHVPIKMRHIDSKFNKALDLAYKKLNIDKEEAIFLKFKNIIDSYVEQNDDRKIDNERLFVRRKMDELTKEIKQLENNISFISNASEDNPLIKNVYRNIENYKNEFEVWKRKISYLNQINV